MSATQVTNRLKLYAANFISNALPQTRGFAIRRIAYSLAGIQIAAQAKVCGGGRIHYANVEIGESTWIGWGAQFIAGPRARISVGAECDIGPGVMFVVGSHAPGDQARRAGRGTSDAIRIGSGTRVGARCTLLAGASVGRGCVVAAGSVVTTGFGDNVLIGGVPARVLRRLD